MMQTMISMSGFRVFRDPSEKLVGEWTKRQMTEEERLKYGPVNKVNKQYLRAWFNSDDRASTPLTNNMDKYGITDSDLIDICRKHERMTDAAREVADVYGMDNLRQAQNMLNQRRIKGKMEYEIARDEARRWAGKAYNV